MDVHKETVVVCVLPPDGEEGKPLITTGSKPVESFGD
jgi:hypothetical protein